MKHLAAIIFSSILVTTSALAQDIRTEQVRFERGASNAVVESTITGREIVDYILRASDGQYMNVSMATDNTGNYFNILQPGKNDVAMFNGSINDNHYEGILPESGDYKVRVYLMRSAARRDEVANYRLEMIITEGEATSGSAGYDAAPTAAETRAGQGDFDATGDVPCSMGGGQPTGSCPFGVKREGNGSGIVTVTKPDGRTRSVFFDKGKATGYDMSQADPGKFSASKQSDLNVISIGEERYEIPDAVIFGG